MISRAHCTGRMLCLLLFLLLCTRGTAQGAQVFQQMYLNAGEFVAVDGKRFPYRAFNARSEFEARNTIIHLVAGDTLLLKLNNSLDRQLAFSVQGIDGPALLLDAGQSRTDTFVFEREGVYLYYDVADEPAGAYLGAAGMIVVQNTMGSIPFFWNLKEHQSSWNDALDRGESVEWSDYAPDYFTINGRSRPHIDEDVRAKVRAAVGDTVRLYIANTGRAYHSLHFHGFHARIVFSGADPEQQGWEKDTFSIPPMTGFILEMVPDKPGLYPVHDHNLVAISGGGRYPNGMFLMMEIAP